MLKIFSYSTCFFADDDHSEQLNEDDNEALTRFKACARPPYVTPSPANEANKNEGSTSYTTHRPNIPENQPQVSPPGVSNSEGDQIDLLIQKPGNQ